MEYLLKKTRLRLSGADEQGKEKRVPRQKSQSFKGEKKKPHNWLQGPFLGQMTEDVDQIDSEHATAVAAATFAVKSMEELNHTEQKAKENSETSLARTKTKKKDATSTPEAAGDSLLKSPGIPEKNEHMTSITDKKRQKTEDKASGSTPLVKKEPSQADKSSESKSDSMSEDIAPKPESAFPKQPSMTNETRFPESYQPAPSRSASPPTEMSTKSSTTSPKVKSKADSWEEEELANVKERYEKLNAKILEWEKKRREKAKRKLNKREGDLERIRAKALRNYNSEIERIDQVVQGAKAQAQARRRREELKAKEKANKIRTTGKEPKTCFCC